MNSAQDTRRCETQRPLPSPIPEKIGADLRILPRIPGSKSDRSRDFWLALIQPLATERHASMAHRVLLTRRRRNIS